MNKEQIINLIEVNKIIILKIEDFAGNTLTDLECNDTNHLIDEFESILGNFAGYKKLVIRGKDGKNGTTWKSGCKWQYEFPGTEPDSRVAGIPVNTGGIGAQEYIGMYTSMMEKNNQTHRELLEERIKNNNSDPTKWMPLLEIILPAMGLAEKRGIAGTEKTLEFGDVEKMTPEEIEQNIGDRLVSLSKKIKGSDMLRIIVALDENPQITKQSKDIAIILKALINKPHLLEMALKFI